MSTLQPIEATDSLDKIIEKINSFMNTYQGFETSTSETLNKHHDIIDVGANIVADKVVRKLYVFKSIADLKAYTHLYTGDHCMVLGSSEYDGDIQYYKIRTGAESENSPTLLVTVEGYRAEIVPDSKKQEIQQEIAQINADILSANVEILNNKTAIADALTVFQQLKTLVEKHESSVNLAVATANEAKQIAESSKTVIDAANTKINQVAAQIGGLTFSVTQDNILKVSWEDTTP